jgi:hypothetical protein
MRMHDPIVRLIRFGIMRLNDVIQWEVEIGKTFL